MDIVSYRGKVMEACVKGMSCLTASIIGLSDEIVKEICMKCASKGVVQITNYCCIGNITIGGEREAVEQAMDMARNAGAKYCIPLRSNYPFHTKLLYEAGEKTFEYIKNRNMGEMTSKVVFNYVGRTKREDESIAELLNMQVQSCIQLEKSIHFLEKNGVDIVIDLGPGNMNTKLIKRITPTIRVFSLNHPHDIEEIIGAGLSK